MNTKNLISLLISQQEKDGHFPHLSWAHNGAKARGETHHSVFFTSLILNELCSLPKHTELEKIKEKAKEFLLSQKTEQWTFNYWHNSAPEFGSLPNDWDDTACTLGALYNYNPDILDGNAKANLTKTLIACETGAGGPYKTWLTHSSELAWNDADVAVNANIGWLLQLQGISLPPLDLFLKQAVLTGSLTSPYYPSIDVVMYFVSRSLGDEEKQALTDFIKVQPTPRYPTHAALRVLALLNCGADKRSANWLIKYIENSKEQTNLAPFCFDPVANSKQVVAGSQSLNAVLIERALQEFYNTPVLQKTLKNTSENLHKGIIQNVNNIIERLPNTLTDPIPKLLHRLEDGDKINQITLLPLWTAQACGFQLNKWQEVIEELGTISLLGWMAYTLYDDVMDDGNGDVLPLANRLSQELTLQFLQLVKLDANCINLFQEIMNKMETANFWEVLHCRNIAKLPDYQNNIEQLANKSFGHVLAPLSLLIMTGHSEQISGLKAFFTHYLIAKQLHDDAHDWLEDLKNSQITYVNTLVLHKYGHRSKPTNLVEAEPELRQIFWNSVIDEVLAQISNQLDAAQQTLKNLELPNSKVLEIQLLHPLRQATLNTVEKTAQARQFLHTYQASQA